METGVVAITINYGTNFPGAMKCQTSTNVSEDVHELVQKILAAKQTLLNVIECYKDDVVDASRHGENASKKEQRRLNFDRERAEEFYKDFAALLNDFIIDSASKVRYYKVPYTQYEPVRRLTQNHLVFLDEKKSKILEIPKAIQPYKEYMSLVEKFLPYVKFQI